jgi:hypothetical protein
VIADLSRYHGFRLRRRSLSSREIDLPTLAAMVEYLPPGSAVWAKENGLPYGWTLDAVLVSDLYHAFTGSAHPMRAEISEKARARDALARLRAQRARLANHK